MQIQARAFNVKYDRLTNKLVSEVQISTAFNPSSQSSPPNLKKYVAIWDTGATNTVISQKVVQDCGFKPIGIAKVNTASGTAITNVYFASLWLPNKVCIPQLRVTEGTITGDAELLIGMDIISRGDFAVTNKDGKTNLSFRIPSIDCIDFVKQHQSSVSTGNKVLSRVGRNDPCPCGSGKKYKRCCGK